MSAIAFPTPDARSSPAATQSSPASPRLARRMPDRQARRAPRLRDRRAHRLSARAARGRAAAHDRGGLAQCMKYLPRARRQCRAARRRHLAVGRRHPAGGCDRRRPRQDEPHSRGRSRRTARARRGRRHQSRHLRAVAPDGFFYAPDPSSQLACTIGGNIGMNSGGAHCLKYGVTTNNLLGVRLVHDRRRRSSISAARRSMRRA